MSVARLCEFPECCGSCGGARAALGEPRNAKVKIDDEIIEQRVVLSYYTYICVAVSHLSN